MKNTTVIATNRFGLGARPGDLEIVDSTAAPQMDNLIRG